MINMYDILNHLWFKLNVGFWVISIVSCKLLTASVVIVTLALELYTLVAFNSFCIVSGIIYPRNLKVNVTFY